MLAKYGNIITKYGISKNLKSKSNSYFGDGGYPRNAPPKTYYAKTRILKPTYGGCVAVFDADTLGFDFRI